MTAFSYVYQNKGRRIALWIIWIIGGIRGIGICGMDGPHILGIAIKSVITSTVKFSEKHLAFIILTDPENS